MPALGIWMGIGTVAQRLIASSTSGRRHRLNRFHMHDTLVLPPTLARSAAEFLIHEAVMIALTPAEIPSGTIWSHWQCVGLFCDGQSFFGQNAV